MKTMRVPLSAVKGVLIGENEAKPTDCEKEGREFHFSVFMGCHSCDVRVFADSFDEAKEITFGVLDEAKEFFGNFTPEND